MPITGYTTSRSRSIASARLPAQVLTRTAQEVHSAQVRQSNLLYKVNKYKSPLSLSIFGEIGCVHWLHNGSYHSYGNWSVAANPCFIHLRLDICNGINWPILDWQSNLQVSIGKISYIWDLNLKQLCCS